MNERGGQLSTDMDRISMCVCVCVCVCVLCNLACTSFTPEGSVWHVFLACQVMLGLNPTRSQGESITTHNTKVVSENVNEQ